MWPLTCKIHQEKVTQLSDAGLAIQVGDGQYEQEMGAEAPTLHAGGFDGTVSAALLHGSNALLDGGDEHLDAAIDKHTESGILLHLPEPHACKTQAVQCE
jgi:hypothetical protein